MKTAFFTTILLAILPASLNGQSGSINNTLGSGGSFNIKDGSSTFLSLSQSNGYLGLNKSLTLPVTTDATLGVIFKGAGRFIHDYQASGTNGQNTFVGVNSGNFTMSGSGSFASNNTSVGHSSLTSLTTGYQNSAFGYNSLTSNTTGNTNSAFGNFSLWSATGTSNSAFGAGSLLQSTGNNNSALGNSAGSFLTTGSNNTCIGNAAQVPLATSDNQIRIGDASVTYAGVQVAWTLTSDKRWKSNIVQSDLGLDFISKLRPVSYTRKNDEKKRTEYGFIAQEIEEVLKGAEVENAGMLTIDDAGRYELRYNDLLAPMVKAIQELKSQNDALKNELVTLRGSIAEQVKKEVRTVLLKAVQPDDKSAKVSLNESKD